MNLLARKVVLFLILSLVFLPSARFDHLEASTIYYKDGAVTNDVSDLKRIGDSFLYKLNGKSKTVFVYRVSKILDDNGNVFYEPSDLTYSKKWNSANGYEYSFKKNNNEIATGHWTDDSRFEIDSGSLTDGIYIEYYDSGALKSTLTASNNTLNRVSKIYFDSGKIKREGTFVNGREEGISKLYDNNSDVVGTSEYKNGKKNGETKLFYKSGKVKAILTFSDGKVNGIQKTFYESGKKQSVVHFSNGVRNGSIEEYYENGKLMMKGSFINDNLDGEVTQYYESGRVKSSKLFDNGKLVK